MTKAADKLRIVNMMTLKECWYKLDEEYGDIATFVAEVLVPNKIIQCYKCDPFYDFCS
jgi:hypothetical protein